MIQECLMQNNEGLKMNEEKINLNTTIDYYIFIDYSGDLIGYNIIEKEKVNSLMEKISKFGHYKKERHKGTYLIKIKKTIKKTEILNLLYKQKIRHLKDNVLIFLEVLEFVGKHDNCAIFLSVDNNQFDAFSRLMVIVPHKEHVKIIKESELKKGSVEYRLSLIIDNMLVIERLSK